MANVTQTEAAAIIANFWLDEVIGRFNQTAIMTRLCSHNYTKKGQYALGQTVNIPKRGATTVRDKAANVDYVSDNPTNETVPVVIDKHKYVQWGIEDPTQQAAIDSGLAYLEDAVPELVEAVESDLIGLYVDCAMTAGTAATPITPATITNARLQLNLQKAPGLDRVLLLDPTSESTLIENPNLVRYDARGKQELMEQAKLGRLYGFETFYSTLMPTAGGATYSLAFHPKAFTLVSRALPMINGGRGVFTALREDPQSGLVFRYQEYYSGDKGAMQRRVEILYGVKSIDEDRLAVAILT